MNPKDSRILRLLRNYLGNQSDVGSTKTLYLAESTTNSNTNKSKYRFLRTIPWILCLLFGISFLWDFNGVFIQFQGVSIPVNGLLRIVSVSGLIGFLTNWIAITMLFRPRDKRPILGQGLIPAEKHAIASRLSAAVDKNLVNPESIKVKLMESDVLTSVISEIEQGITRLSRNQQFKDELFLILAESIDEQLSDDVKKSIALNVIEHLEASMKNKTLESYAFKVYKKLRKEHMVNMIVSSLSTIPKTIYDRRNEFDEYIHEIPIALTKNREFIEDILLSGVYDLLHKVNIRSIIEEKLNNYDEGRLEFLIRDSTIDQLNYIKYLGGLLGVLGGLVIWNAGIALSLLLLIGSFIYILDIVLIHFKSNS